MKRAEVGYALFDSAIGRLGVAWSARGIRRIQLPEKTEAATLRRLADGAPGDAAVPPARIARAVGRVVRHLAGERVDLSDLPLDLDELPPFRQRVYTAARGVSAGETATYGELAKRIGAPGAARAVGGALGVNPFPIVVPCHRILAAGGKPGGFSAYGGLVAKARLLEIEGVALGAAPGGGQLPLEEPEASQATFDARRAVAHLRRADPKLGGLIDRVGPCRLQLEAASGSFAMLAKAIVYQQLTARAAATIFGRFVALYPRRRFPRPEEVLATSEGELRRVGLSTAKARAVRDLAEKVRDGVVPPVATLRRMPDEQIVERLTAVHGVGRWTVEMLLIFRLGRPDVLPVGDYGIRKGFALAYGKRDLPSPADLARHGERWRPHRTVASWYLWRALE